MYIFEEQWGAHDTFKLSNYDEVVIYLTSKYFPYSIYKEIIDIEEENPFNLYLSYLSDIRTKLNRVLEYVKKNSNDSVNWDYFCDLDNVFNDNILICSRPIIISYREEEEKEN